MRHRADGGAGYVLVAERQKDGRVYALKTFKKLSNALSILSFTGVRDNALENAVEGAAKFYKESLVWICLGKHRNIVQAFWYDLDERYRPFLVMEYVEGADCGPSLQDWLDSRGRLGLVPAIRFTLDALNGLQYARRAVNEYLGTAFVHRDIKPENLLMGEHGLKVSDFGLVMSHGGTPLYRPPEQWENREVEEKTDVYALGCVLYEMVTGEPAFWGKSREELKRKHCFSDPPLLRGQPVQLMELVAQCLTKSPDERPTFAQLEARLQAIHVTLKGSTYPLKKDVEPLSSEELNARGSGFDQLGHHDKALSCYEEAIHRDPRDDRFYLNRGNCRFFSGDQDGARDDYCRALRLAPELLEPQFGLMAVFERSGDTREVLNCYRAARRLGPKEPLVYVALGNFWARQRCYIKALPCFRYALKLQPRLAEAHLGLGNTYLCLRKDQDAEAEYYEAIRNNPLSANAYLSLARLYDLMGRHDERDTAMRLATHLYMATTH